MATFEHMIKKSGIIFIALLSAQFLFANGPIWGKTGHRVTGEVAQRYLTRKAKKAIDKLLHGQTLAEVSNYADDIKSDPDYRKYGPWHYVNMPGDKNYGDVEPNPSGDIIIAIRHCISVLKDENSPIADKEFYLKLLVHFIGDLHQPMHIGRTEDRGGNDIQIRWFDHGSNLHRLWDSDMIDHYGMSYTELANKLPKPNKKEIKELQEGDILIWIDDTHEITNELYDSVEVGQELGYAYSYKYWPIVEKQLFIGGVRLAGILNNIFS